MTDYILVNGELYHHGVKGMKWGVRRAKKSTSKSPKKTARNKKKKMKEKAISITAKVVAKGAKVAANLAMMSLADDIFYDGAGKKTIKAVGRKSVEAYMKARGHTVIGWVD